MARRARVSSRTRSTGTRSRAHGSLADARLIPSRPGVPSHAWDTFMMAAVSPAQKRRFQRQLVLLVPALLFGLLVSLQWRTQAERSELTVRYNAPLTDAASALQNEQNGLKAQLTDLRARLDGIQRNAGTQSGTAHELQTRIEELKARAGLTDRTGDGVVVQLDDSHATGVA